MIPFKTGTNIFLTYMILKNLTIETSSENLDTFYYCIFGPLKYSHHEPLS